ncbi:MULTISPECIES: hypothetical protein [Bradyrhizobium]|uniref:hypothetical protein n=1 Tax=Bradyrhizobium TaxID=374 RepID=UPI001ED9F1D5|nr:hypothetical protein [Bradyrhizobium zhengyangense]MCG2639667.1 hypothetical protein [Bradyrhizobium zhengyangense]
MVRKWWVVWPLYAGLMGFALGASFFFALYGRNVTESSIASQHEQQATNEATKSKKDETDEALAYYTLWLMAFTGVLAFATVGLGIATVLLYGTGEKQFRFAIRSSIKQSRDMRASIAAAQAAARSAADAAYSERAWMSMDGFDQALSTDLITEDGRYPEAIGIAPKWKNTGRSPAIRVEIFTTMRAERIDGPIPTFETPPPEDSGGIVGPGLGGIGVHQWIYGDNLGHFRLGAVRCFIYSRVRYRTIFEPDFVRTSEICFSVQFDGLYRGPDGAMVPRLIYTNRGSQNTAT